MPVLRTEPESVSTYASHGVTTSPLSPTLFSAADLIAAGLSGGAMASERRARLGAILGVGCANAKTFLKRINHYGVTREEFSAALAELDTMEEGKC